MQEWSHGGRLTGAPTTQSFLTALDQLASAPTRRPRTHLGALAIVQVDNIDRAIQRLGHRAGEKVLDAFAVALGEAIAALPWRVVSAKIGGGEFGILAPHTSAQALADHLRAVPTAAEPLLTAHGRWSPTASVGISAVVSGEGVDRPLVRADQALAQAKSLGRARVQTYDSSTYQFAAEQIDLFVHIEALKQEINHIRGEMLTDPLTRVRNRRALDEWLAGSETPNTGPCEILFVDIDRFHSFNHTRGQEAGDQALRQVASALSDNGRAADLVFRRGGEEFVIVLPAASRTDALRVAERHRRAVEALAIPHGGTPQTPIVTVMVSIASTAHQSAAEAIENAAVAAFAAKDLGACNIVLETGGDARMPDPGWSWAAAPPDDASSDAVGGSGTVAGALVPSHDGRREAGFGGSRPSRS